MKKFIALLLLFQISFCFAQNNRSIEGTTWRGIDNGREAEVIFLPNGMATFSYHNGTSIMTNSNVKWSQNGNRVYWEINNKFVEKNGEINGDSFKGGAKNIKGLEWAFIYKLTPSNAAPFNPSKELALEQNRLMEARQAANNSVSATNNTSTAPKPEQNSQDQTPKNNNFLIGMCYVSSDRQGYPPLNSCRQFDLVNRNVWATGGLIFAQNTVTNFLFTGSLADSNSRQQFAESMPITYKLISPTEILITTNTKTGCIISEKYLKIGNAYFNESLPARGSCSLSQIKANESAVKSGRKAITLIRAD